jgi:hypothetical protein
MAEHFNLHFEIILTADMPGFERQVEAQAFEREGWKSWGSLSHFRITVPSPAPNLEPTGKHWIEAEVQAGTVAGRAAGFDHLKQEYVFNLELSGRKTLYGKVKGRAYGEFSKAGMHKIQMRLPAQIILEKGNRRFTCYGDCAALIPQGATNARFKLMFEEKHRDALWKFNASGSDPDNNQTGNFLWILFKETGASEIVNIKPADGSVVKNHNLRISGDFKQTETENPIDINSFYLLIDEGKPSEIAVQLRKSKEHGDLRIDEHGFEFIPGFSWVNRNYTLRLSVANKNGKVAQVTTQFTVQARPENTRIAELPVTAISDIGAAHTKKLAEAGIRTIADLRDSEPVQLATATGIALRIIAAAREKARIASEEVHILSAGTASLRNLSIGNMVGLLPEELKKAGQTRDRELITHIRSQIGILYMCLDSAVVDKLRLSELLWNE